MCHICGVENLACNELEQSTPTASDGYGCLVTTAADLDWLDDDDGSKLAAALAELETDGYHDWPDHVPAPIDGYEFASYGPLLFSRPACSRWHRLFFRLPNWIAYRFI